MKIAYIVLAYKNPGQVFRMIRKLKSNQAHFFLHIDANSDIKDFKNIPEDIKNTTSLSGKRFKTNWSSFGCVDALLYNMQNIVEGNEKFDFIITLTGQDYPIKSPAYIESFFEKHRNNIFIQWVKLPNPMWKNGGRDRMEPYHFNLFKNRITIKILHRVMIYLIPILPKKSMGVKYNIYGSEGHFSFPTETVKYMLEFIKNNPKFLSFFKHTYMPDETIFQTLLMNSPLKDNVINDTLKYIDWTKPQAGFPATLSTEDITNLEKSEKLFARKFDTSIDSKILDLIDGRLLK
ncbi:MAG: beta-1,6-N-acetylglucosaminyltransferase [bacterium]